MVSWMFWVMAADLTIMGWLFCTLIVMDMDEED